MPGGIHLRLVAPLDYRIFVTARAWGMSEEAASKWVGEKDHNRAAFYRRYWPKRPLVPEDFCATFNTVAVESGRLVESVIALMGIKGAPGCNSNTSGITKRRCCHATNHPNT
jgi:hypothetical protein